MGSIQERPPLRGMQAYTNQRPLPNNEGYYCPIPSTFPAVKPAEKNNTMNFKRPMQVTSVQDVSTKRSKVESTGNPHLGKPPLPASAQPANEPSVFKTVPPFAVQQGCKEGAKCEVTTLMDVAKLNQTGCQSDPEAAKARAASLLSFKLRPTPSQQACPGPAPLDANIVSLQQPSSVTADQQISAGIQLQGGQAHGQQQDSSVSVQGCLPCDWAIKSSARFASRTRFECYDACVTASAAQDACWPGQMRVGWKAMTGQKRLRTALTSYRHPQGQAFDATTIATLRQVAPAILEQRVESWRQAFIAAYMAVRHRKACAMFLDSPPDCRQPVTVLFTAPGVRGCKQPQAILSCSSAQQRARMTAAGLEFSMPFCPTFVQGKQEDKQPYKQLDVDAMDIEMGMDEGPDRKLAPGQQVPDLSPQSMIVFTGSIAAHALFDWLLQESGNFCYGLYGLQQQGGELMDLPAIYSPVPFQGSTAWRPDVKSMTSTGVTSAFGLQQQTGLQQHVLEVSGPVLPWTLARMCAALAGTCHSSGTDHPKHTSNGQQENHIGCNFTVDLVTARHNLSLNVWSGVGQHDQTVSTTSTTACHEDWEISPGEACAVTSAPAFLSHRVIHRATVQSALASAHVHETQDITYHLKLSG